MKRMGAGGFTIVESMIVLGVTAILFISMATLVSGRQNHTRFQAAVVDLVSEIQTQINQVSTGYYPSLNDFSCTVSGDTIRIEELDAQLGTNSGCTYLGRAMMYGSSPGSDPDEYRIHTIVGLRRTGSGGEPTTIREAAPRVLAPGITGSTYNPPSTPDKSELKLAQFGTSIVSMRSLRGASSGGPENIAGFAIVVSPNQQITIDQDGSVESGTVIPSIIPIPRGATGTSPGVDLRTGVGLITRSLGKESPQINAESTDGPIELCFRSGTTDQSALITIGSASSTTSIDYRILNTVDCT